jgi:hypothetical protein
MCGDQPRLARNDRGGRLTAGCNRVATAINTPAGMSAIPHHLSRGIDWADFSVMTGPSSALYAWHSSTPAEYHAVAESRQQDSRRLPAEPAPTTPTPSLPAAIRRDRRLNDHLQGSSFVISEGRMSQGHPPAGARRLCRCGPSESISPDTEMPRRSVLRLSDNPDRGGVLLVFTQTQRAKPALNAFAITLEGRIPARRNHRPDQIDLLPDRPIAGHRANDRRLVASPCSPASPRKARSHCSMLR